MSLAASLSAAIAFMLVLTILIVYVLHFAKSDFSSDDAVLSLQAELMWRQHTLFPSGWIGNNGDLMMPSGALIIAPLLTLFRNSFELHAVASVLVIGLLLGSFAQFLRTAGIRPLVILIATTIVATGLSRISAIMLYVQTTYVWWPAFFFIGATLILLHRNSVHATTLSTNLRVGAMTVLVFLITVSNPGRSAVMLVFPLYAFDRVLLQQRELLKGSRKLPFSTRLGLADRLIMFGLFAGFVLGYVVYKGLFWNQWVQTMHFSSALRWEGVAGVVKHTKTFLFGWFDYLGGVRELNAPVSLLEDLLQPMRLAFSLWLSWAGIAESIRLFRVVDPVRNALVAAMLAAFIPILFLYISFAPLAINFTTTRYFTVPILLLVALAAFRISSKVAWGKVLPSLMIVFFSIVLVLVSVIRFIPAASDSRLSIFDLRKSHALNLLGILKSENLTWGYATWWNAGVVTILSKESVRVNPIQITGSKIEPFPVMTQRDFFLPGAHRGESFLILRPGEDSPSQISTLTSVLGTPHRKIVSGDTTILVYETNVSAKFMCSEGEPMNIALSNTNLPVRIHSVSHEPIHGVGGGGQLSVVVKNSGRQSISGRGSFPISVGVRLLEGSGAMVNSNWLHFPLPCSVDAGEERLFKIPLPRTNPGIWKLQVGLVQEGVSWFSDWGVPPQELEIESMGESSISKSGFESN